MSTLKINRKTFPKDIIAGLTAAIAAIPDGMATASLAGVSPIYGLYNLMAGTPIAALFFAAAMDFEVEAPKVGGAKHPGVVVILRGRHNLGSTAIAVFERYAKVIHDNGGMLFLAEVSASVRAQLEKTGAIDVIGADIVLPAGDLMFASLQQVKCDSCATF